MKLLCLNCRGCGLWAARDSSRDQYSLIKPHRPALVFLSESKSTDKRAQDQRFKFGFSNAFGVKCAGLSGGLVLFWNSVLVVSLKFFSKNRIDVMVVNEDMGGRQWRFTGFYDEPARSRRKRCWGIDEISMTGV